MKAVAVISERPDSIHLADLPKPSVHEIPNGCSVLVQVLRVGVDSREKERQPLPLIKSYPFTLDHNIGFDLQSLTTLSSRDAKATTTLQSTKQEIRRG